MPSNLHSLISFYWHVCRSSCPQTTDSKSLGRKTSLFSHSICRFVCKLIVGNVIMQIFVIWLLTTSSDHPHSSKAVHASSAEHALLPTARRLDSTWASAPSRIKRKGLSREYFNHSITQNVDFWFACCPIPTKQVSFCILLLHKKKVFLLSPGPSMLVIAWLA